MAMTRSVNAESLDGRHGGALCKYCCIFWISLVFLYAVYIFFGIIRQNVAFNLAFLRNFHIETFPKFENILFSYFTNGEDGHDVFLDPIILLISDLDTIGNLIPCVPRQV